MQILVIQSGKKRNKNVTVLAQFHHRLSSFDKVPIDPLFITSKFMQRSFTFLFFIDSL